VLKNRWGDWRTLMLFSLLVQLVLSPFLAHGYDFLVSLVAARNVVSGVGAYEGGYEPNPSYGDAIQGIGEFPLWPIILALAYAAAGGNNFIFNLLYKLPIIASNITASRLLYKLGSDGWRDFLLNPYILFISAVWGKPDVIAALLGLYALTRAERIVFSALLTALSLNIKPLALPLIPAITAYNITTAGVRTGAAFLALAIIFSIIIFLAPFQVLGWRIETPLSGLGNWFRIAGGLSPANILESIYEAGYYTLPDQLLWLGYLSPASLLIFSVLVITRYRPRDKDSLAKTAFLGVFFFLLTRTWVSEQNLAMIFALYSLSSLTQIPKPLWTVSLVFAAINLTPLHVLYPIWPTIIIDYYNSLGWIDPTRLLTKFITSLLFYGTATYYLLHLHRHRRDKESSY